MEKKSRPARQSRWRRRSKTQAGLASSRLRSGQLVSAAPPAPATLPLPRTWQVQQADLRQGGGHGLHLGAQRKDAGAQAAD